MESADSEGLPISALDVAVIGTLLVVVGVLLYRFRQKRLDSQKDLRRLTVTSK